MKHVQFNQDYKVAIDGIKITEFGKDDVAELPAEKADLYVSRGVCEFVEPLDQAEMDAAANESAKGIKAAEANKALKAAPENKGGKAPKAAK